jgi:hypothetical protein
MLIKYLGYELKHLCNHDDYRINEARLRLWTAAENEPIVYPPGDM